MKHFYILFDWIDFQDWLAQIVHSNCESVLNHFNPKIQQIYYIIIFIFNSTTMLKIIRIWIFSRFEYFPLLYITHIDRRN